MANNDIGCELAYQVSKSPGDNKPLQHTKALSKYGTMEEDGTIQELGYVAVYRRVFHSVGNMCMVVSLTSYGPSLTTRIQVSRLELDAKIPIPSPLSAIMITASYQIIYGGYWGLSW